MVAQVGDTLPDIAVDELKDGTPTNISILDVFRGKRAILFGVPGAFTPGCTKTHLPGYVADYEKLKEAGADVVACISVNDAFVMGAWGDAAGAGGKVRMLADPRAEFAKALDIAFDASGMLGNERCRRFSAIIDDTKIVVLNLEETGGMTCSLSNQIIDQLKALPSKM